MSNTQDLRNDDAVAKLREIVGHNATCMFHTRLRAQPHTKPMMVQEVDDNGDLWFLSGRSSEANAHIQADPKVMLTITDNGHSEYLVVNGEATIVNDMSVKKEMWTAFAKAWFPKGVEDPELTLLKVKPIDSRYWDTTDGKVVQLLKIAGAAISGKPNDSGSLHGTLTM